MKGNVKSYIYYFLLLFAFWIILSLQFTLEIALVGSVVVLFIMRYTKNMLFTVAETNLFGVKKTVQFLKFIGILLVEILKSNIQVAKIVLSPSLPIEPSFIRVPRTFKRDFDKVIYANSVTLTPGTLTVDVDEDGFLIHALTREAAEGLDGSIIEKTIRELEAE